MPKQNTTKRARAVGAKVLPFKPRPVPQRFQVAVDERCGDLYAAFGLYGGDTLVAEEVKVEDLHSGEIFLYTCGCHEESWARRFDGLAEGVLLYTDAGGEECEVSLTYVKQCVRVVSIACGNFAEAAGVM